MAVIYLKHDTHGAKVACSEQEATYDEAHGWVRFTVDAPVPVADPVVEPPAAPEEKEPVRYIVTGTNGMLPENMMAPTRRARRKAAPE